MKKYGFALLLMAMFGAMAMGQTSSEELKPANNKTEYQQSYQWRIKQTSLGGQYIPIDLNDAFNELDKLTEAESRTKFSGLSESDAEHKLFFSLGRWMSVNWSFYEGSRYSAYLREAGLSYPDDMTSFMLIAYHRYLNKRPVDAKRLIEGYKAKRKKEQEERLNKSR